MNIFNLYLDKIKNIVVTANKNNLIEIPENLDGINVDLPPSKFDCDISTNVAMFLSKVNKKPPDVIAKKLIELIKKEDDKIEKISVVKPGFINIKFKSVFWNEFLEDLIKNNINFGKNDKSKKRNFLIEFVSANPTGPLHVGHCRGAILGDVLSNILLFTNNKVTKEYYVNDYGNQIKNFVSSVYYRILEIKNKKPFLQNNDLYPGDYIIDIAKEVIKSKEIKNFENFEKIEKKLSELSIKSSMKIIKQNLKILGIKHDNFIYESNLVKNQMVSKAIKKLERKNYIYKGKLSAPKGELTADWKIREQLLFKSTMFGDDTDRPLQKSDGSWTYFAGDVAYHSHKISRKFNSLINILGADHSGYTKRIISATAALSDKKVNLICKISQLVKLFKKGEPFKMSKRKGDYITVHDLIREVGKDSVRFMMLNRNNDVEIEFDFEKVTEKSKDNPVFYVQYAYARINSIFRLLKLNLKKDIKLKNEKFNLNSYEMEILKKISEWPKCIEIASKKLEPHRIPFYLYDLVTLFHSYWSLGKDNKELRFLNEKKSQNNSRLLLLQALSIVIENGMKIIGASTPKSM